MAVINIERTITLRQQAIDRYPSTIDPDLGIVACGNGKYKKELFNRDLSESGNQALPFEENLRLPGLIPAVKKSLSVLMQYQGKSYNARTDETPGRYPHEVHTEISPQDRLWDLKKHRHPVTRLHGSPVRTYVNYFAGDANGVANRVTRATIDAIAIVESPRASDEYAEDVWLHMDAAMQSDMDNAKAHQSPVPVTDPANKLGYIAQVWRDGKKGYVSDNGRDIRPPVIFVSNVAQSIRGALDYADVTEKIGYPKRANEARLWAEQGMEFIEQNFWMEDEQFYAPAIDSRGQIRFISCDPVDLVDCGVITPERAKLVIKRLKEPDMLSPFGIRTRSRNSPGYTEDGFESYQRGSIWPQRSTKLILGASRWYGLDEEIEPILESVENYLEEHGFRELGVFSERDNRIRHYTENGRVQDCDNQAWVLYGYLGASAWALRRTKILRGLSPHFEMQANLVA